MIEIYQTTEVTLIRKNYYVENWRADNGNKTEGCKMLVVRDKKIDSFSTVKTITDQQEILNLENDYLEKCQIIRSVFKK